MAKTIADYKNDYATARASGNAAGMTAANQAANALRASSGQAAEYANQDIANTASAYGGSTAVQNPYANTNSAYAGMMQQNNDLATQMYKQQIEQGTNKLNYQKQGVNDDYNTAATQAYVGYEQGKRDMPQQMAMLGMTGGASESSLIKAQSTYENNLTSLTTAKQKAMNDIDLAISDLQASGNTQAAQYILANAEKIADNYVQSAYRDTERTDTLNQQTADNAYRDKTFNFEQQQYQQSLADNKFDQAYKLLSAGFSNQQIADSLGVSLSEVQQMLTAAASGSGGGGSSGRSGRSGGSSYAPSVAYAQETATPATTTTAAPGLFTGVGNITNAFLSQVKESAANKSASGISNKTDTNTSDWVSVPGYGRVTFSELKSLVDSGKVIEKLVNGKYTYTLKR